jgi:hypothetical protein
MGSAPGAVRTHADAGLVNAFSGWLSAAPSVRITAILRTPVDECWIQKEARRGPRLQYLRSRAELVSLRLCARHSQSNARTTAILVDELNAGGFQGASQRCFIRLGCGDFSVNDFYSADRCNANL